MAERSNFNIGPNSTTQAGTTLDNLKAAVCGETGATTKYTAFAAAADEQGFPQIARLFRATAAAEKIHIEMEAKLIEAEEPDYVRPTAEPAAPVTTDCNLIDAALGEIYETSDMYPTFIKVAEQEGNTATVGVFTRAKLAEAYHAQRYLDAYNLIDNETDEKFYVCPVCGYIEKGRFDGRCPICGVPAEKFMEF